MLWIDLMLSQNMMIMDHDSLVVQSSTLWSRLVVNVYGEFVEPFRF